MILMSAFLLSGRAMAADVREEVAEAVGADALEELADETGLSEYGSILGGYDAEGFLSDLMTEIVRAVVSPQTLRDLAAVLTTVLPAMQVTVAGVFWAKMISTTHSVSGATVKILSFQVTAAVPLRTE